MLALCALCSIMLLLDVNVNVAEWVEMPQFSDQSKIYRTPSTKQEQFFKFRHDDTNKFHVSDDQRNGSQTYHRVTTAYRKTEQSTEVEKITIAPVSTTPFNLYPDQIADSLANLGNNDTKINTETIIEDKLNNRSSIKNNTSDTVTTEPSPIIAQETQDTYYNHILKQNDIILQYLPMDTLKSVHRILQSQPVSFEGKLQFLKMFEKTLMAEIESRLIRTMTPSRKIRDADYWHDDHDEHSVGFPSIEGALMAISFLTFAVYLVRLVMLLFRNMNNPMPTTTAATVFLGKRKRSADLNDDAARILNNINNFDSNF